MNELGYIKTQEEYQAAIAEVDAGLGFSKEMCIRDSQDMKHLHQCVLEVHK